LEIIKEYREQEYKEKEFLYEVRVKQYNKVFTSTVILAAIAWALFIENLSWKDFLKQLGIKEEKPNPIKENKDKDGNKRASEILSLL